MASKQDDGLFLMEVLIDKVVFVKSPCFSDKDFRTCVSIKCPSVEPLEICDDDPDTGVANTDGPFVKNYNNGKSCLFSLTQSDINSAMSKFPVKVTVYKTLPCGCLPTKIVMGEATIDMTKEFVQARKKFLEDPNNVSYQALKDTFHIVGTDGAETGEVSMFLRISCFGKSIITRFQGSAAPPKLGTGGPSIHDRSCNPKREFQSHTDPCACGASRSVGQSGMGSKYGTGTGIGSGSCPIAEDPYDSMPCEDPDDPCFCSGPKAPPKQPMTCRNTDQYCLHVPKDCCPPGNKVIFQMPTDTCTTGHKQRAYFNITNDGVGDMSRDEPDQLVPTTSQNYSGVVYDYAQQVIKLRINKTVEMPGRKSKMDMQFITPVVDRERKVPVNDSRTAQCHPVPCPRCCPARMLGCKFQTEEPNHIDRMKSSKDDLIRNYSDGYEIPVSAACHKTTKECLQYFFNNIFKSSAPNYYPYMDSDYTDSSQCTLTSKTVTSKNFSSNSTCDSSQDYLDDKMFGNYNTAVFVSLMQNQSCKQCSSTQATASINKCLQVYKKIYQDDMSTSRASTNSCLKNFSVPTQKMKQKENLHNSEVYFFGRKKSPGMGSSNSKHKSCDSRKGPVRIDCDVQNSQCCQTFCCASSTGTSTGKVVSIKETSEPCPALANRNDLSATVSHIRIGPKEPCPVHGFGPCQGPKCIIAGSGAQDAPVKVSTATNPRRGVFELVIRRLTGAPLARNELMLEWTPPPSIRPPCASPCDMPCVPTPCRPSKCKMVLCKPKCRRRCKSPCGPPKKFFKPTCCAPCIPKCKSPCGPPCKSPCQSSCTSSCGPPCKTPCGPPCRRSSCRTAPCKSPFGNSCKSPCGPCRSPCVLRCKPRCRSPFKPSCGVRCKSPCGPPCKSVCAPCESSCRKSPCRALPCKPRYGRCRPCKPCRSIIYTWKASPCLPVSCPPGPCRNPCFPPCCKSYCTPCSSSPCFRPCPVGRGKRTRRSRSHPRIKTYKKRVSPCLNRSKCCPVVRSRSLPGPCSDCCPPFCEFPPRKCCSVSRCK